MDRRPIGIYDSGVGGLTVLMALKKALPNEDFIYFADTVNLPYGNKSPEQITEFSHRIISWMQNKISAKMVISACHTSSALALESASNKFKIPVIGTIMPLLRCIINNNSYKRIGIIATLASATSRAHETIFLKNGFTGTVRSIACPDFVPLIESNQIDLLTLKKCATEYLSVFKEENLDTLIYGCTHYPFIKNIITNILPIEMQYIDPAEYISIEVEESLSSSSSLNKSGGNVKFYSSSDPEAFAAKLNLLTGIKGKVVLKHLGEHYES